MQYVILSTPNRGYKVVKDNLIGDNLRAVNLIQRLMVYV